MLFVTALRSDDMALPIEPHWRVSNDYNKQGADFFTRGNVLWQPPRAVYPETVTDCFSFYWGHTPALTSVGYAIGAIYTVGHSTTGQLPSDKCQRYA